MINPTLIKEVTALVLLLVFITTFYLSMPPMVYALGYAAVVAMFIVFVVSLLAKTDSDEREQSHKAMAAEAGFISGGVTLLIAIAYQTFVMQHVDYWLFVALVAMMATRLTVRFYLDKRN